jgi:hypothetical protein
MNIERARLCPTRRCVLLPTSPALCCSFECVVAEFGGTLPPRSALATPLVSEATRIKLAA